MIKLDPEGPHGFEYAEFIDDFNDCSSGSNPNSSDEEETFEIDGHAISDEESDETKQDVVELENVDPSILLTEEDKKIVSICTDPELKELILLNRKKNTILQEAYEMFNDMIMKCELAITEENGAKKDKRIRKNLNPKLWRLGYPYFKSVDDFPCPRNADIIKKQARGELFFYGITPSLKWRRNDISRLLKGVSFWYKNIKISELQKQIEQLNEKKKKTKKEKVKLQALQDKFVDLEFSKEEFYPALADEKCLDWPRIAFHFFDDKFSAEDCEYFWKNYLHPSINKEAWTDEENDKLKSIAFANNYQNWDLIAEQLGNKRSGFIACLHFYSKVKPHRIHGAFSAEEDKLILRLIDKYKQGSNIPWEKIVHYFPKRHRRQLYYRYNYFLKENYRLREKFTEAEDILLLILIDRFGRKFTKLNEYFPQRSANQLKGRYFSQLRRAKKRDAFTVEEDKQILSFVEKNGSNHWAYMEEYLHRDAATLRQRYWRLVAFQQSNPDKGLEKAPRRKNWHPVDSRLAFLRLMVDKFKIYKKIPTIEEINELLQGAAPSTSQIDRPVQVYTQRRFEEHGFSATFFPSLTTDALLKDYFKSSTTFELDDEIIESTATTVQTVLKTLQAKLSIPKNYRSDPRLDSMDVQILDKITSQLSLADDEYVMERSGGIRELIPANLDTIAALKFMLEQNETFKMNADEWPDTNKEEQLNWCMNNYFENQEVKVQQQLTLERDIFSKRFTSLFKIPAMLSTIRPDDKLCDIKKPTFRTYKRKPKPTPSPVPLANLNSLPSTSVSIELEPTPPPVAFESVFVKEEAKKVELIELDDHRTQSNYSEDPLAKLTVIESFQQQIFKTIEDLTRNPTNKKFFHHVTKFSKGESSPVKNTSDKHCTNQYSKVSSTTTSHQQNCKKFKSS